MDHSHHQADRHDHSSHIEQDHDHDGHKAFFYTDYGSYMLFKEWKLVDARTTFLGCLVLVIIAVFLHMLKFLRHRFNRKCLNFSCRRYILSKFHLIQTGLHTVQFASGYLVMLAVMTYNIWVGVAAIAGIGLGYFFFGWGEFEDLKRHEMYIRRRNTFKCGDKASQELLPLSKDASADTLLTNVSSGRIACDCDETL